jgi:hypothetical protein
VLGFLQLCADRRYHRPTIVAFEKVTGLAADQYWIEAAAGGAPSWSGSSTVGALAYGAGARVMGWAAHGDDCLGFPDRTNGQLRRMLEQTVGERARDFPEAAHFVLFGEDGEVTALRSDS